MKSRLFCPPAFSAFAQLGPLALLILAVCVNHSASAFTDANWVALGSGATGSNSLVNATLVDNNGNLYIGGVFTSAGGVPATNIAKWNGSVWSPVGGGILVGPIPYAIPVAALAMDSAGNIYAGGNFTNAGGVSASNVAKWNGTNWSALGSGVDWFVTCLHFNATGNLIVGGAFTHAGGVPSPFLARWDGAAWSAMGANVTAEAFSIASDASFNTYVGGFFTYSGSQNVNYIAKWNGSAWSALGTGMSDWVVSVAVDGSGNVYASGNFTNASGVAANHIARWNGASWSALGQGLDSSAYSLVFDSSGKLYASGDFRTAGGQGAYGIAVWDGTNWSTFGSGVGATLASTMDSAGNLYVGGYFNFAGTNPASHIAKGLFTGPLPNQLLLSRASSTTTTNVLRYLGTPGAKYSLDLSTNLALANAWAAQATNSTPTNNATTAGYTTFTNITSKSKVFYRTRLVP